MINIIDNDDNDNDDNDSNVVKVIRYFNILKNNSIYNKFKRHKVSLSIYHYHYYKLKLYYNKLTKNISKKKKYRSHLYNIILSTKISLSLFKLRRSLNVLLNNTSRKKNLLADRWRYKRILSTVFGAWLFVHKDDINKETESINMGINHYKNNISSIVIKKLKANYDSSINSSDNTNLSIIFLVLFKLRKCVHSWKIFTNIEKYKQSLVSYKLYIHINDINKYRYFQRLKNRTKRKKLLKYSIRKMIRNNEYYNSYNRLFITTLKNIIINKKYGKFNNCISFYARNIMRKYLQKWNQYKDKKCELDEVARNVDSMYIEKTLIRSMKVLWEYVDTKRAKNMNEKYESLIFYQLKMRRSLHKWNEWFRHREYSYTNITIQQKVFRTTSLRRALVSWLRSLKRRFVMIPIYESSDNHMTTFWRHRMLAGSFTNWQRRLKSKRYQRLRAKRFYHNFKLKRLKEAMENFKDICAENKKYKRHIVKSLYLYESRRYCLGLSKLSNDLIKRQRNQEIILKAILFWKLWREDNYIERWKALVAHRRFTRTSKLIPEVSSNINKDAVDNIIKDGVAIWQEKIMFIDKSERKFHKLKAYNDSQENETNKHDDLSPPILKVTAPTLAVSSNTSTHFEFTTSNSLVKVPPRTLPEALSLPIPLHAQKLSVPFNINPSTDFNKLLYDSSIIHSDSHKNSVLLHQQNQLETELKRKQRLALAKDIIKFVSEFKDIGLGLIIPNQKLNNI